jgi:hypothetical protein
MADSKGMTAEQMKLREKVATAIVTADLHDEGPYAQADAVLRIVAEALTKPGWILGDGAAALGPVWVVDAHDSPLQPWLPKP